MPNYTLVMIVPDNFKPVQAYFVIGLLKKSLLP